MMIVVKVMGGLGNQLFQIAYAIALAKERNNCPIYLDTSAFETYKIRPFSASHLNLPDNIEILQTDTISSRRNYFYTCTQVLYRILQRIIKELGFKYQYGRIPLKLLKPLGLIYNFDTYCYKVNTTGDDLCLYGYFQNEEYFQSVKEEVIESFSVLTTPTEIEQNYIDRINSGTAIAVSMRLGDDYKESGDFVIPGNSYYIESLKELSTRYPNASIFIFSDDIIRARKVFKNHRDLTFIEGCKDYQSLRLLALCDHYIIANSSFSWWGAYLSKNENKKVIAPKEWFTYMDEVNNIYSSNMEKR
ncbi:alpha-1,2-fucosyltransferase [Vibrio ishigakensis]|uniref:Alpha-1,2-fucosyltransferase n=1 Tax=Vibrio ishigakensis TaxID=1481914 RepID=A0A0B8NXC5_9VIBR|nr:alpha-1,2-fucosyltransferase [Vibrio ishigakensis]GAM56912.1 alpha-1,2-fucosyltransferase [Vibrio ishigakensis]